MPRYVQKAVTMSTDSIDALFGSGEGEQGENTMDATTAGPDGHGFEKGRDENDGDDEISGDKAGDGGEKSTGANEQQDDGESKNSTNVLLSVQ